MECQDEQTNSRQLTGAPEYFPARKDTPPGMEGHAPHLSFTDTSSSNLGSPDSQTLESAQELSELLNKLRQNQAGLQCQNEELRRTKLALEESQKRYFDLYDSAPVGYCTVSEAGIMLDANSTMYRLFATARAGMVQRSLSCFIHPEQQQLYADQLQLLKQSGEPQSFELQMLRQDGSCFWAQVSAAVGYQPDRSLAMRVVIADVSARKAAEAALKDPERNFMLIASNIPGPVSRVDRNLRYLFVNHYYEQITGKPQEALIGQSMREVFGDVFFQNIERYVNTALAGNSVTFPSRIPFFSGQVRCGLTTFIPSVDAYQNIDGFFVVGLDVTEHKHAEAALATSAKLLEITGQLAKVGGWELDLSNNELFWNHETCRIHEIDSWEAPTLDAAIRFYDGDAAVTIREAVDTAAKHGTSWDLVLPLITAQGSRKWIRTQGVAVQKDGKTTKLQGAIQDITERKQSEASSMLLESQLRESQKMEAIGTLAGGVAHDFNNILAAIMGNADIAIQSLESPAMARYCLREICKASERATDLVRQILSFSRRQATDRKLVSLVSVVEESIRLLRATLPARVALTMECASNVPMIMADATQIEQVILNLATNAVQALNGCAGCIGIQVDSVPIDDALLEAWPQLQACAQHTDRVVRLVVTDDGRGMDAAILKRLFEPFFTTKPVGEGTGLGLAVVHGIVRTHEGAIAVDSHPGQGAAFTIYLPAAPVSEGMHGVRDEEPELVATLPVDLLPVRILYVDDDPAVMNSIKNLLEHYGFVIDGYIDQNTALEAFLAKPDRFDLVVSDYNMPCLSGIEFASCIQATRHDLPVVMISGLVDDDLRATAHQAGVSELISKPFSLKTFCEVVRRVVV